MIDRIKAFLSGATHGDPARRGYTDLQVAAAALLVECARMDADFEDVERTLILELVRTRFELTEAEAESLLDLAGEKAAGSSQLYGFTRIIKDNFSYDERVDLVEMLWEVVYADGRLHDLEANLMRRIAGLVYVSDRDSGAARKRALKKLGLKG